MKIETSTMGDFFEAECASNHCCGIPHKVPLLLNVLRFKQLVKIHFSNKPSPIQKDGSS